MTARRISSDLSMAVHGSEMFSKKVALQRLLNRTESAFMEFVLHGLPKEVAIDRINRSILLAHKAFIEVFGPDFDGDVFQDFVSTAYDVVSAHPHDDALPVKIMVDYLRIACHSAEAVWPEGALKKSFPFSPKNALAPSLASLIMKLARCADVYDLRFGRTLFIRAMSTLVAKSAVDLSHALMPEGGRGEIVGLTQSLLRRVGGLAIEAWREIASEMVLFLRQVPLAERADAALAFKPMARIEARINAAVEGAPSLMFELHQTIEAQISQVLSSRAPSAPLAIPHNSPGVST